MEPQNFAKDLASFVSSSIFRFENIPILTKNDNLLKIEYMHTDFLETKYILIDSMSIDSNTMKFVTKGTEEAWKIGLSNGYYIRINNNENIIESLNESLSGIIFHGLNGYYSFDVNHVQLMVDQVDPVHRRYMVELPYKLYVTLVTYFDELPLDIIRLIYDTTIHFDKRSRYFEVRDWPDVLPNPGNMYWENYFKKVYPDLYDKIIGNKSKWSEDIPWYRFLTDFMYLEHFHEAVLQPLLNPTKIYYPTENREYMESVDVLTLIGVMIQYLHDQYL